MPTPLATPGPPAAASGLKILRVLFLRVPRPFTLQQYLKGFEALGFRGLGFGGLGFKV